MVIINSNLIAQFTNEIYNPSKEDYKKKRYDSVQCTGLTYELLDEEIYLTRDEKNKKIKSIIKDNYKFLGYIAFINHVKEVTMWDGKYKDIDDIEPRIINNIKRIFSNRVFIIDEAHNIRNSDSSKTKTMPILKAVIKHSTNTKLVLMTATPMYNSPTEIIDILNLLMINDGMKQIKISDIFKDKQLTTKGAELLNKISIGFVSYLRGEKPPKFPFRIYPKGVYTPKPKFNMIGDILTKDKHIKFLKLYKITMSKLHSNFYTKKFKEIQGNNNNNNNNNNINVKELLEEDEFKNISIQGQKKLTQISNIVYPTTNGLTYGNLAYSNSIDNSATFIKKESYNSYTKRKTATYQYQPSTYKYDFLDINKIEKYSMKIHSILDNIFSSTGLVFVYSEFLAGGIIPLALALERNGYKRYTLESETQLLNDDRKVVSKCYMCGKNASNKIHNKKSDKFNHIFYQGKYLLLAGDQSISKMDAGKLTEIINNNNNKIGKNVKVLIGTSKTREGLDLHKIRQINIMEPWYNLSRTEQIIGRGVRYKSHCGLSEDSRNVEIYLMCSYNKYSDKETIDEAYYRLSENKDIEIKKIERILKVKAIDCVLNKVDNVLKKPISSNQITSKGIKMKVTFGDIPFTRECDYLKNCEYKCCWEPDKNKKYKIDNSTYNLFFALDDINNSINIIKNLYRINIIYTIYEIVSYVNSNDNNIENLYINIALDEMIKNKNILYDKFDREGYLIYKGKYYIFQPLEIKDENIPMYYRSLPLKIKPDKFTIIDKIQKGIKTNNKKNKEIDINYELKKIEKIFPNFEHIILLQLIMSKLNQEHFFKLIKNSLEKLFNKKENSNDKLIIKSNLKNIYLFRNKFIINPQYSNIKNLENCFIGIFLNKKLTNYINY